MAKYHATYGPGSTHGYYEDLVNYHTDDFRYAKQAKERLLRHADETDLLDEARYVRTIENTINRSMSDEDERRALSTAATSDGVFVVPQYLVDEADVYHSYQSALIPQCVQVPDVGYGVALNIPTLGAVTTTAAQATPSVSSTTGQQTTIANENTGVSDSSPSGAYQSTGIVTFAGEVAYSQQLHDRSGPKPYTIDAIITRALRDDLSAQLGAYAFSQVVAAAAVTNGANTYANSTFYEDVAETQATILTGAGVKMPASHAFTSPTLGQWLLSQSDTNGRPLLTPHLQGTPSQIRLTDYAGAATGYTGTDLLGSHFFLDGTVPNQTNSATLSQIIFANTNELFWTMSPPAVRVISEGLDDGGQGAPTLTVLLQYYCYAALVVRRSTAVAALNAPYLLDAPSFT